MEFDFVLQELSLEGHKQSFSAKLREFIAFFLESSLESMENLEGALWT